MTILGLKTGIPSLVAARFQQWAIVVLAYQYKHTSSIEQNHLEMLKDFQGYHCQALGIAKARAWLIEVGIFNITHVQTLLVTAGQLGQSTRSNVYVHLGC